MSRKESWVPLILGGLLLVSGCSGPEGSRGLKAAAASGASRKVGAVTGIATYRGPDVDVPVSMSSWDPVCADLQKKPVDTGRISVRDGKLANVFVYIKRGLPAKAFPVPTQKAELIQQGCFYRPRVQGLQVGQMLVIKNADPTPHNVHAVAAANAGFNQMQPFQSMQFDKIFQKPEVMVEIKCDVHPWMVAYVGILDHPFYAVTRSDGSFRIPGLPAGAYTLEAWHEALGTIDQEIRVDPGKPVAVHLDFQPKP